MKILVTGANGQLGCSLKRSFADAQDDVVYTDVQELDITDLAAVRAMVQREGIEAIVNCAGYTDVERAEQEPELAEKLNTTAVENLALAMKEADGWLLHISTDYVYGGKPLNMPIGEEQEASPLGAYARSKWLGEEAVRGVGCRHVIIRTAWLYSEYGRNFVKTMLRLTAEKPSLKVVFDQVGTPTYAGDLADVLVCLLHQLPETSRVYHYTNEGVCSWYDFACSIAEISGHDACDIRPCHSADFPSKVHRPAYSVLDKGRIKDELGILIPYWRDSLRKCLKAMQ